MLTENNLAQVPPLFSFAFLFTSTHSVDDDNTNLFNDMAAQYLQASPSRQSARESPTKTDAISTYGAQLLTKVMSNRGPSHDIQPCSL